MSYNPNSTWKTAYRVDFASLPSTTARTVDGTEIIDGKTWYAQNVTNADNSSGTGEMRVINGEGLVIDPNANSSDNFNGTRTGPNWSIKLSDLGLSYDNEIRFWAQFSFTNVNANFENIEFGLEHFQSTTWRITLDRGYDNLRGNDNWDTRRTVGGGTVRPAASTNNLSHDVAVIHYNGFGNITTSTAASVSDYFPSSTTLQLRGQFAADYATSFPINWDTLSLAYCFSAYTVNTNDNMRVALKKLRIEYR